MCSHQSNSRRLSPMGREQTAYLHDDWRNKIENHRTEPTAGETSRAGTAKWRPQRGKPEPETSRAEQREPEEEIQ